MLLLALSKRSCKKTQKIEFNSFLKFCRGRLHSISSLLSVFVKHFVFIQNDNDTALSLRSRAKICVNVFSSVCFKSNFTMEMQAVISQNPCLYVLISMF